MPERRTSRLGGAIGALAAIGLAVGAPGVLAADTHWAGSDFTTPFVGGKASMTTETFPIGGIFVKSTEENSDPITSVSISFREEGETDDDEQTQPTTPQDPTAPPADEEVRCVPEDLDAVPNDNPGGSGPDTSTFEFTVPTEHSVWPCNGRYVVEAVADTTGPSEDTHTLTGVLDIVVKPEPVEVVKVAVEDDERTVKITWDPLPDDQLAVDALGYRVERAGPGTTEGAFPEFLPLGADRGLDDEMVAVDSPRKAGVYRYRVRSLRDGPDGPVLAPAESSAFADATVIGAPASPTTTATPVRPSLGGGRPVPRTTPSMGPATTIDTGYEDLLDYGDREPGDSPELAGDSGRSIIRTDDGVGLVAPVAGALVLAGWAGHLVYLNRLAKQF